MRLLMNVILLALISLSLGSAKFQRKTQNQDVRTPTSNAYSDAVSVEGSGDDDYYYDYDDESSGLESLDKDEQELEKIYDIIDKTVETEDVSSTTAESPKDDIHFVEEEEAVVPIEKKKSKKKGSGDKSKNTDDLLYEYYNEYFEEDYEDSKDVDNEIVDSKVPPVVVVTSTTKTVLEEIEEDFAEAEKTSVFPPSYIFLIIASALVSFTVFMLAFLVCRRTVIKRRQKKLVPFVVTSPAYGPPSLAVKSSGSIVKSYHRVPSSTKEFLQQQQQLDLAKSAETDEPLLP